MGERGRAEALKTQLGRARQEAASASALAGSLEGRLRRAEDEVEAAAGESTKNCVSASTVRKNNGSDGNNWVVQLRR